MWLYNHDLTNAEVRQNTHILNIIKSKYIWFIVLNSDTVNGICFDDISSFMPEEAFQQKDYQLHNIYYYLCLIILW